MPAVILADGAPDQTAFLLAFFSGYRRAVQPLIRFLTDDFAGTIDWGSAASMSSGKLC